MWDQNITCKNNNQRSRLLKIKLNEIINYKQIFFRIHIYTKKHHNPCKNNSQRSRLLKIKLNEIINYKQIFLGYISTQKNNKIPDSNKNSNNQRDDDEIELLSKYVTGKENTYQVQQIQLPLKQWAFSGEELRHPRKERASRFSRIQVIPGLKSS